MYLGKDIPIERISKMLPVIFDVTSSTTPFSVASSEVGCFPAGDDGVPVIAKVSSPPLHEFRERLTQAFDANDLEYDKKFPEYKPHVTLAYDGDGDFELEFPEIVWGAHELVLWGSNRGTGRLVVKFPLSLPQGRTANSGGYQFSSAYARAAIQVAMWGQKDSFA